MKEFVGTVWFRNDESDYGNNYVEVSDDTNESFLDYIQSDLGEFEGKKVKINYSIEVLE